MKNQNTTGKNGEAHVGTRQQSRPSHRGLITVIAVIIMLVVAGFVVHNELFRIKYVMVESVSNISSEEVVMLAGISDRTTIWSLNEGKIREGINSNMYLDYQGYETVGRHQLILYVNERKAAANMLRNGLQYIVSDDGMVLECKGEYDLDNGCITVTGISYRDVRVGSIVSCQNEEQFEAYKSVIRELQLQGICDETAELNFGSLDNIYLVTVDGYTVNLGDTQELQGKIGTMRAVVQELRKLGLKNGVIEATVPGKATYRPVN